MQSHVENDLHKDAGLQSELRHALEVLINKHTNIEMPSQSNVNSIMAYIEVGESRVSKVHLLIN